MTEKRDYTPYQQKVIRNYYRNQDAIRTQSLSDVVADIWLATTEAKKDALWMRAEALLVSLGIRPETIAHVVGKRKVEGLAALAAKAQDRPPGSPGKGPPPKGPPAR